MRQWTWGAGQGIYAENPNRVFLLFRGELPNIKRPDAKLIPEFGPSLIFPIGRLPWRDATVSALPGSGGTGQDPDDGPKNWMEGKGVVGVDAKWEHCLTIVDSTGKIIETFPQYDHLFKRPHYVTINPYDPEKHIWIVDDHMHAIYIFTHDMKELVQTHWHAHRAWRRWHAFQPAHVPLLAAGQHPVRGGRIQRHARREIRQERKISDGLGHEGHASE